jgi:type I restriction enzyme S subunit
MNAERLLAHYERIADAPDAIPRLRRFVLDLAVRGKLAPQDPNDEPASELLKRIGLEKARLVKAGEIRKEKQLPPVDEGADFDIPASWCWTRLGIVTSYIQRGKSPKYAASDGALVVSQKCVQWRGLDLTVAKHVTLESLADYEDIRFLRDGDLLWNSTGTGTIGRVIRLVDPPEKLVCDSHVTVVRCLEVDPEYIRAWLRSDHVYALIEDRAAGSTNQVELTAQMAIGQIVPLPPLAEQHRIVAKVDELMARCDRLKAARTKREEMRDRLTEASLARLNAAETDPATFADHVRFALNNLAALSTRPDQVNHLRQTILNLAVRGKLVPQESKDQPASALLKLIAAEKVNLQKTRGIRPDRPLPPIAAEEPPFPEPPGWHWVRAQDLSLKISDGVHKKPNYVSAGIPFITVKNLTEGIGISFRDTKFITERDHLEFVKRTHPERGDVLITKDGTIGVARVVESDRVFSIFVSVALVKMVLPEIAPFLTLCINSETVRDMIIPKGAALKHLHLIDLRKLPLPLPPLAEQRRIVTKVYELMELCDRLEASLTTADDTQRRLLEALLAEALAPDDERELEAAE